MENEYFDIVDGNNQPTGERRLRSEAHSLGLWHRTVHIYLFREINNQIEFLVHLRSPYKDLHPNQWDTRFGGHVKAGENLEEAVQGELVDEIGLSTHQRVFIEGETYKHDEGNNREFTKVYYYRFAGDIGSLKFNDGEIQEVKWMNATDIEKSLQSKPDAWAGSVSGFLKIFNFLIGKLA